MWHMKARLTAAHKEKEKPAVSQNAFNACHIFPTVTRRREKGRGNRL